MNGLRHIQAVNARPLPAFTTLTTISIDGVQVPLADLLYVFRQTVDQDCDSTRVADIAQAFRENRTKAQAPHGAAEATQR